MFMVNVVEYVIGKVNVMVNYMLGGMHDIVVSVLIHVGGEDGLVVESLSEPYVVQLNMCVVEYMLGKLGGGGACVTQQVCECCIKPTVFLRRMLICRN